MKCRLSAVFFLLGSWIAFSEGIDISAGVSAGFDNTMFSTSILGSESASKSILMASLGAYADATYVRLAVDYMFNAGKPDLVTLGENIDPDLIPDNYLITRLNIMLYGKFPFDLGPVTIWPAAGVQYGVILILNENGDTINDLATNPEADVNDFFLIAGIGLDFAVGQIMISPCALLAFNLTPVEMINPPAEAGYFGLELRFSLGIGYRFLRIGDADVLR